MSHYASDSMISQKIGYTVFTWDESDPLSFSAVTQYSSEEPVYTRLFDLNELEYAFEREFLFALKDLIMQRHLKVKRITVNGEFEGVMRLLRRIQSEQVSPDPGRRLLQARKITAIDAGIMVAITAKLVDEPGWIDSHCIARLRTWFNFSGEGAVFKGIEFGSFPASDKRDSESLIRQNIIALAMSRTIQVSVLLDVERRFTRGEIPLGVYVLWNLTNFIYARPDSMRQIRCGDVTYKKDRASGEMIYTLWLMPAKRHGFQPKRMPYRLTPFLGQLLFKQQSWVLDHLGPLYRIYPETDQSTKKKTEQRMALFPRIGDGTRKPFELKNHGMLESSQDLRDDYLRPIKDALTYVRVSFNAMRHTIGTQLAAAGVSVAVIQAVLRHADDKSARRYIDLAATELRKALSEGLEALEEVFPAYGSFMTANQLQAVAKDAPERVTSSFGEIDPSTGAIDIYEPGVCGQLKACGDAVLGCYGCYRWVPNVDADHGLNLKKVQERIARNQAYGKPMRVLVERDQLLEQIIKLRMAQFEKFKSETGLLILDEAQES